MSVLATSRGGMRQELRPKTLVGLVGIGAVQEEWASDAQGYRPKSSTNEEHGAPPERRSFQKGELELGGGADPHALK